MLVRSGLSMTRNIFLSRELLALTVIEGPRDNLAIRTDSLINGVRNSLLGRLRGAGSNGSGGRNPLDVTSASPDGRPRVRYPVDDVGDGVKNTRDALKVARHVASQVAEIVGTHLTDYRLITPGI